MRDTTVTKRVLVPLTELDREQYGKQMAEEIRKRSKLDAVMKRVGKMFREKIQRLDDSLDKLSIIVGNDEHNLDIECGVEYDWEENLKRFTPVDCMYDHVSIDPVPIPASEQQEEIVEVVEEVTEIEADDFADSDF